jgi:hypothetical protein
MMLSSATYAWFTMSREVEVNNIKMTATVPEDIQISLGHLTKFGGEDAGDATVTTASSFTGLAGNQGILATDTNKSNADDGTVKAPNNGTDAVSMLDWASSADISAYYRLGKIIPASSTTGENIFFTPDASGNGKTLKAGAKYYQAANISGTFKLNNDKTAYAVDGTGDSAKTTLHAITKVNESEDKWGTGTEAEGAPKYQTATEWNVTNDDGYFVDIPVWIRSSAQQVLNLSVDAYVTTNQAKDDDDLYCAARAVILYNDTEGSYAGAPTKTSNLIRIKQDGFTKDGAPLQKGDSIVNYMYTTNSTGDAVSSTAGEYGNAIEYQGLQFLPVAAGVNNNYGPMTKATIRVWLEGEDPNCWNSNAGQDFNISLKFSKDNISNAEEKTPNNGEHAIAADDAGTGTYAESKINHAADSGYGADSTAQSLVAGARVWVKSETTVDTVTKTDLLQFEYNGEQWALVTDGTFHKYEGFKYSYYENENIENATQIAAELKKTITTLALVKAHDATTEAIEIDVTAITP